MQLRREVFIEGMVAIANTAWWVQKVSDTNQEVKFVDVPELHAFAIAMTKLNLIGNSRTVTVAAALMNAWRETVQAAVDFRFRNDPANSFEKTRREFAQATIEMNLALRTELSLEIDEDWFRNTTMTYFDGQLELSNRWLASVRESTQSEKD